MVTIASLSSAFLFPMYQYRLQELFCKAKRLFDIERILSTWRLTGSGRMNTLPTCHSPMPPEEGVHGRAIVPGTDQIKLTKRIED